MRADVMASRVGRGFAKAARLVGRQGVQYRPAGLVRPMQAAYATPMLAFDVEPRFSLGRSRKWGEISEYVLTDLRGDTRVGDILVCGERVSFVASVEEMRPPLCILCNRTVRVQNMMGASGVLVEDCPAAIVLQSRGEDSGSGIPGSTKPGRFVMYLPGSAGVVLQPYMTVTTDLGVSYTINAAEMSGWGIRCVMSMQQV